MDPECGYTDVLFEHAFTVKIGSFPFYLHNATYNLEGKIKIKKA